MAEEVFVVWIGSASRAIRYGKTFLTFSSDEEATVPDVTPSAVPLDVPDAVVVRETEEPELRTDAVVVVDSVTGLELPVIDPDFVSVVETPVRVSLLDMSDIIVLMPGDQ